MCAHHFKMKDVKIRILGVTQHLSMTAPWMQVALFQFYIAEKPNIWASSKKNHSISWRFKVIFFLVNFFLVNNKWIYIRSCNKRDNLTEAKDAEAYLCHSDFCNSGNKYNSGISIIAFSIFATVLNFLRVWKSILWF